MSEEKRNKGEETMMEMMENDQVFGGSQILDVGHQ